jgi:hypothetical protein
MIIIGEAPLFLSEFCIDQRYPGTQIGFVSQGGNPAERMLVDPR